MVVVVSRSDAVDANPIKNLERSNLGSCGQAVEKDFGARSCTVGVAVGYYYIDDEEEDQYIIIIIIITGIFMK